MKANRNGLPKVMLAALVVLVATSVRLCAADAAVPAGAAPGPSADAYARPPSWPQHFELRGPESAGFGFLVTQPGKVGVDVQATGARVMVTLSSGRGVVAQHSGTGLIRLEHLAAAQELEDPPLWRVEIALAQPLPAGAPQASGTVSVHEPPVDSARLDRAMHAIGAARASRSRDAKAHQPVPGADESVSRKMDAAFAAHRQQFEEQQRAERSRAFDRMRPLAEQARARLAGTVGTRAVAKAGSAIASSSIRDQITRMPPTEPTASSSQALESAGSGPAPQSVMQSPLISSLSVASGRPGMPVMLTGQGFSGGGKVFFILNPGMTVEAPIDVWSDTQIFTSVPPPTKGIFGFDGQVFVERADGVRSQLVAFRIEPALEMRELRNTADRQLASPSYVMGPQIWHTNPYVFWGYKGEDYMFVNARLRNGWTVSGADIYNVCVDSWLNSCQGGSYVDQIRQGTESPYLKVHWWLPPGAVGQSSGLKYTYSVQIVGPAGIPDGIAVP